MVSLRESLDLVYNKSIFRILVSLDDKPYFVHGVATPIVLNQVDDSGTKDGSFTAARVARIVHSDH